jgi:hypothetical protein
MTSHDDDCGTHFDYRGHWPLADDDDLEDLEGDREERTSAHLDEKPQHDLDAAKIGRTRHV